MKAKEPIEIYGNDLHLLFSKKKYLIVNNLLKSALKEQHNEIFVLYKKHCDIMLKEQAKQIFADIEILWLDTENTLDYEESYYKFKRLFGKQLKQKWLK